MPNRKIKRAGTPLTDREMEVCTLLATGKCPKEVAVALNLGTKTVETHKSTIYLKLGVHSMVELVLYSIKNGLIDCPCINCNGNKYGGA